MRLWERVRAHLGREAELGKDRRGQPADLELRAATAVLLLEAAYGDEEYAWAEHRAILKGLERGFGIGRREALELLEQANAIRPPAVKLADVTELLRERYDPDQRRAIVALLWQVVDADDVVETWEEAFANHVARAVGMSREQAERARSPGPARTA